MGPRELRGAVSSAGETNRHSRGCQEDDSSKNIETFFGASFAPSGDATSAVPITVPIGSQFLHQELADINWCLGSKDHVRGLRDSEMQSGMARQVWQAGMARQVWLGMYRYLRLSRFSNSQF